MEEMTLTVEQPVVGEFLPKIVPTLDLRTNALNYEYFSELIAKAMRNMLTARMTFTRGSDLDVVADQRDQFHSLLPLVTLVSCDEIPGNISFYALSKYRENSFKFFFDIVSHWIVPGKRLNVVLLYALDFRMPEISDEVYTFCEVVVQVDERQELEKILRTFPIFETELRLGIASKHFSRRVMEAKGFSADEKTAQIHQYIANLIERRPADFDQELLTEMQHLLVTSPEEFKGPRECRHLSRIISVHYLFRKSLREAVKHAPQKRHLSLKLFQIRLKTTGDAKPVLAVLVGINFFRDKEVFAKTHILKAIQNYIPTAKAIDHSFFANRRGSENLCTLYIEVEKSGGDEFTSEEIRQLRQELPLDLKERIEHLMHPIFMPRNEEEIIRNILSLSNQIKFLRDIPQVIISFDEQSQAHLFFNIILVRVLKAESQTIQEMFKKVDSFLEYIPDRIQHAGTLRRKYKKEATVFRLKLAKEQFLRRDHSIDLNKARQAVVAELCRITGEVRDFNGGMITKQHEVLCKVRELLQDKVKFKDLLLENFFYSLTPVIMRSVLEPVLIKKLFLLFIKSIAKNFPEGECCLVDIASEEAISYVMIKADGRSLKEELSRALSKLQLPSSQLTNSFVSVYEISYLGYIFSSDDSVKQAQFIQTIQQTVENWRFKRKL